MVETITLLRDVIFYIKDFLANNITDPIASTRPSGEKFVMTSYPTRATSFPMITIKDVNSSDGGALGLQSEASLYTIDMEIRVWARNVAERDTIASQVYQALKDNQIGASGTSQASEIHDFRLISMINIEPDGGTGNKSKVMTIRFIFVAI